MRKLLAALALIPLAACGHAGAHPAPPPNWRTIADRGDREHIRKWRDAWMDALAKANPAHAGEIADAGVVLQADAALTDPRPPATDYRCRVFKIAAQTPQNKEFAVSEPSRCRISEQGALLRLERLDGVQRPAGLLYPDDERRMIFLGTNALSDEKRALGYGHDSERDLAGLVERIGANHWRLVIPYPHWESELEVVDLVPEG
ncbi:MAG: DUF4893 domain-containing protein [Sphingomonadaceae bacterium]|nr:DUF4893 domain-containing protein [Sphingomonadaceae bacterium]